ARIKGIIAEQTGYDTEMLEDNLDLEADLGIDTVKQVEIFGKISDSYSLAVPEDLQLSDLNTIDKLAGYIAERAGSAAVPAKAAPVPASAVQAPEKSAAPESVSKENGIYRFSMTVEERPLKAEKVDVFKGKRYIVIKDSHGFADEFIEYAKNAGSTIVTAGTMEGCDYNLDVKTYDTLQKSADAMADAVKDINGIIHFGAVDGYYARKLSDSDINLAVKSQFILAQNYFDDLNREGSLIAALSFNSVVFAYGNSDNKMEPLFAGVSGLYKTLNKEIAPARVKVVDFDVKDPKKSSKSVMENFITEIASDNREVEAGYKDSKRYGIRLVDEVPVMGDSIVKNGDRFLVTGGARGITFNILMSVVKKYKTNLVILGRSDVSKVDPKYLEASVTEKTIFDDLKTGMAGSKPLEIKKAASKIMTLVETVRNIEELKNQGVQVDYHACDVTDGKKVKQIVSSYDRIDGVLHAAGVEISQFLTKMDAWSFNMVFDVKVNGLRNLIDALKDMDYRYMMTFSSVTARFGNEGQTSYTSANDMIGKMLQRQKQLNPDRAYKVYDWTAWEGAGMATKETVKKVLEARGLEFVPLDFGVQCFMDDLCFADRTEVLVSGMDHAFDPDKILPQPGMGGVDYFLDREVESKDGFKKFERLLTAERDLFLFDHEKDGVPLFLGATGLETMAEAASRVGEGELIGMAKYQIPYGIKLLKNRPKALDITAENRGSSVLAQITSVFRNPAGKVMGDPKLHYQAEFIFGKPLADKKITVPEFKPALITGNFQDLIYHPKRLFMHGLFKTVEELLSFEEERMITRVCNSSDREFFAGVQNPEFTTDPVLVDAMFQTGGMLDVMTTEKIILPYMMKEMKFYRKPEKNVPYLCITEKTAATADINTYNLTLCSEDGQVYLEILDFEMIQVGDVEPGMSIKDKIKLQK
ncbi:MAG: SDR family oxidoreductase, partial [Spirochaetes bacterium]|nr:SDR family oxidoreductase [Spirochaetota bacterium]